MGERTHRVRMNATEMQMWEEYKEARDEFEKECKKAGIPIDSVSHYWYKSKKFSIFSKQKAKTYKQVRDDIIKDMDKHSPDYKLIKREKLSDPRMLVVDISDLHIGKYSSKSETSQIYSMDIAKKRALDGIEGIIKRVQGFNIDKIIYVGGNDKLHVDSPHNTTTSGTRQDVHGMWHEHFKMAKEVDIACIEMLLPIADVHFLHCGSNHDYSSGYYLADTINSWFRKCPNFTADVNPAHRKYVQYGTNLLGFTHGDGVKEQELPDKMKTEARKAWSVSKYGYWYVHHIHHKDRKIYLGKHADRIEKDFEEVTVMASNPNLKPADKVSVEYVRTPSPADSWHHRNGYDHNVNAVEAFLHHPEYGQDTRITHHFEV